MYVNVSHISDDYKITLKAATTVNSDNREI